MKCPDGNVSQTLCYLGKSSTTVWAINIPMRVVYRYIGGGGGSVKCLLWHNNALTMQGRKWTQIRRTMQIKVTELDLANVPGFPRKTKHAMDGKDDKMLLSLPTISRPTLFPLTKIEIQKQNLNNISWHCFYSSPHLCLSWFQGLVKDHHTDLLWKRKTDRWD